MTKSTITREQAQKIIVAADEVITALAGNNEDVHPDDSKKMCDLWDDLNDRYAPPEVVRELARMALAAMDSEPVAWDYEWASCITCEGPQDFKRVIEREAPPEWAVEEGQARNIIPLYRHAQPAPELVAIVERLNLSGYEYEGGEVTPQNAAAIVDTLLQQLDDAVQGRDTQPASERDQVRSEHTKWSQATFGNVGPVGPLKHLSKEALEAAELPGDLSEWADMQFLLWDAQRRAGITDEQITQAMIEKLAVNKQREWPELKDGEPRLHINESSEPKAQ